MMKEAEAFGAKSSFTAPSLDAASLSNIISSVSSSLTSTKTEMTDLVTGVTRAVRQDVRSERQGTADDLYPTDEWELYGLSLTKTVGRVWTWSSETDEFVLIRDPRCVYCKAESMSVPERWCSECNVAAICVRCQFMMDRHRNSMCKVLSKDHKCGKIVARELPSCSVAMKVPIFGEGAERIVRKFRFIDQDSNFIGPKLVAKESRFKDTATSYDKQRKFHANFMRIHFHAADVALHFNKAIDDLQHHFDEKNKIWIDKMPRIEFLETLVVEVRERYEKKHILIEPFLEGEYQKFNNNMGFVKGKEQQEKLVQDEGKADDGLDAIREESEEEYDSDDEVYNHEASEPDPGQYQHHIEDYLFPQAFSHYSFEKTKTAFMVVDLQGVLEILPNGTRKFLLTDPAIHRKNKGWRTNLEFGRTDRGKKGMKAFFRSHSCSDACRLLGLRKVDPQTLQFLKPAVSSSR